MSNHLAIAAVTATLRNLLDRAVNSDIDTTLAGAAITTLPLDEARGTETGLQLNLFLYQTQTSAAWRNQELPGATRPGESGHPPLPLDLSYLLTAYGPENDGVTGHRLLGRAMGVLHDHSLLGADEIRTALAGNDLHDQVERVRITQHPLSLDDMSRLWTAFQTGYRISAAYCVSVVLIESARPAVTPLPVLTIGRDNRGVVVQPSMLPPFPAISTVSPPNQQESVHLGETVTFAGHHLAGDSVVALFRHPRLDDPIEVDALAGGTATTVQVAVVVDPATDAATWLAGHHLVSLVVRRAGEPDRVTNELPVALAPRITSAMPATVARDGNGDATVTLTVAPEVRPSQKASLLLGGREVPADAHTAQTASLDFTIVDAPPGDHLVRVRVDGVDSQVIDRTVSPPAFDTTQLVTIT
jgi:hypothetical protein